MALPPVVPRSVLFGNPDKVSPSVSPDGTLLGYVAPDEGVLNVWVEPLDGSAPARAVTKDRDRGVRSYVFCHDDRTLLYVQDTAGDESWRVYAHDLQTGQDRLCTPESGVQAQLLGHNRWHPTTVLVGLNDRDPQLHDVHRLDLTTGELTLVAQNPGLVAWLIDTELEIRGGYTMEPDGGVVVLLRPDGAPADDPSAWQVFLRVPAEDAATTDVMGFVRDGSALLVTSSLQSNAARLERHDLRTGEQRVLAEDPHYDVAGVWLHPQTLEVQAVTFERDRQDIVLLDESLRPDLDKLEALAGDAELGVGRRERTDTLWLVSTAPSDGPLDYHLYDRRTGEVRYLFPHRAELRDYALAPMEAFSFTARDGLTIHGYLTFPVGVERTDLPAVLLVHGGPWARDFWGYDPEAQWLASRGYLCVQVNFRGSTGYGKDFVNAGDKQWGAAMQDDLTDAVEHLVSQGVLDRSRVGIYGGSYGGYAALAGAAFTPEVYRCAVDLVGPSNLLTLLDSLPEYWLPMIAQMHRRVGDPATDGDLLRERSPLNSVEAIRIPVLVAQGANDPRVKQAEAEQIVSALRAKGLPHDYLLFEDEGHGLAKPDNRERFYAAVEPFLAEHLGGRVQQG
ncbi:MAG: S9 family peptidase [Motilibacteraceae bacterium]